MEHITTENTNMVEIVVRVIIGVPVCLVGIVLNFINIVVFYKQGFGNAINISMFAVAVSDLCRLVALEFLFINENPLMEKVDLPYDRVDMHHLVGDWPHACFFHITVCTTVYVTAERFVCVALPLKVKQIFTPLGTKVVISLIYLLMFLAFVPVYTSYLNGQNDQPARNHTRFELIKSSTSGLSTFVVMLYPVTSTVSFFMLVMFTYLLFAAFQRRLNWRQRSAFNGHNSHAMSRKDTKAVRMAGLAAGVLIVCSSPCVFLSFVEFGLPEFMSGGQYDNILKGVWSFAYLFETINVDINFVLYYKTSSKYKQALNKLLAGCRICCHGRNNTE